MKTLKGSVVSDKMTKSAVVEVTSIFRHPIYGKRVKRSARYIVHNELGAKVGDSVSIQETRPLSAKKRFVISQINKK